MRWCWIIAVWGCSYSPTRADDPGPSFDAPPVAPDAAVDAPAPPVACVLKYGSLPDYELCSSTPTSCTFYIDSNGSKTCVEECGSVGGTCLDSQDGDCDNLLNSRGCDAGPLGDQVCTCAL